MAKRHIGINDAYKRLASACLEQAITDRDCSLLRGSPAYAERLDLLCEIAGVEKTLIVKKLRVLLYEKKKAIAIRQAEKDRKNREYCRKWRHEHKYMQIHSEAKYES